MGSAEEYLRQANEAFYEAFAARDIEAMDELWARQHPVTCIHPGWPVLHGREEVMTSWREILLGAGSPKIRCEAAHAVAAPGAGWVTCVEWIENEALAATNLFVLERGVWQIAHHQSGVVHPMAETSPPSRLN